MSEKRVYAEGHEFSFDGETLVALVWESSIPESARPWFRVEKGDLAWEGQAVEPPTVEPDGRLRFVVQMAPAK